MGAIIEPEVASVRGDADISPDAVLNLLPHAQRPGGAGESCRSRRSEDRKQESSRVLRGAFQSGPTRCELRASQLDSRPPRALKPAGFLNMVGGTTAMRKVFEQIQLVAATRSTVLITGETGTGKELVARALHELSPRRENALVALNCAAIPKDLAESEMFGHAKGAFTGATEKHLGKFVAADHGTLLIDEIGEMTTPVQAKLLRVLETHAVTPVGSNSERAVDVRVLTATHRDLRCLADAGNFREDLFYRLHVVTIDLPPLRQRRCDIPSLVLTFLQEFNTEHGRRVAGISPAALDALEAYSWPGNIRELRHVLESLVIMSRKEIIDLADLPPEIQGSKVREMIPRFRPGITLAELEREAIQQCLLQTRGNRKQTATLLGISTRTLLRKIREYGLGDPLHEKAPPALQQCAP